MFFLPRFLPRRSLEVGFWVLGLGVLDSQFHAEVASGVGKDVEVIMESSTNDDNESEVTTPQFPLRNKHCPSRALYTV